MYSEGTEQLQTTASFRGRPCLQITSMFNTTQTPLRGGTGYFKFPNGVKQDSTSNYNYYRIGQLSNTGVISRYSSSYYPRVYGIFTCEVPDSTLSGYYPSILSEFLIVN